MWGKRRKGMRYEVSFVIIITILVVLKTTMSAHDSTHIVITFKYGEPCADPSVLLMYLW